MLAQVEYYFSSANLTRDHYLRCMMDADGWVPVMLVATFPKIVSERWELPELVALLKTSTRLQVVGEPHAASQALARRKTDYARWPLQGAVFIPTEATTKPTTTDTSGDAAIDSEC